MKRKILLGLLMMFMASIGFVSQAAAVENLAIQPRVIIGSDDRELISGEQLEQVPYRWTVFLDITFEDGSRTYASGAMISKDTVLTCGHSLFNASKGWATNVKVHAGYDGENNKYYAEASEVLGLTSWTSISSFNSSYDLAAVKLDRNLGEQTGWFPLQQTVALQEAVTLTGFPGEKNKTMWSGRGSVVNSYNAGITYSADSTGGNSGSPVYNLNNELVAIHSGGVNTTSNGGSKITNTAKKMIDFWVTGQAEVEVTGVSLSDQLVSIEKDQAYQLTATITPNNATVKEGKWTSSDQSIATVDYKGRVVGKNKGQTTITFTTDDNKKQATCLVNVVDENYVPLERIEFRDSDQVQNIEQGKIFSNPSPVFVPVNASNKEIYYTSSNTDILDMELKDPFFPRYRKAGMVDIYCHSKDNGQAYKVKTVHVDDHGETLETATLIENGLSQPGYFYGYTDVDYFKFVPTESGEYTIGGEVVGSNSSALNQAWEFMIQDENGVHIRTIQQGSFSYSFVGGKTYYLVVKLQRFAHIDTEAYKTHYIMNVFPKGTEKPKNITGITMNKNHLELDEGTAATLRAELIPADTTDDPTIQWSSSDDAIATVVNGEVTGISEGTATITATTSNGLTAICEVTVNKVVIPVERIELSSLYREVCIGPSMSEKINVQFYPENATDKTLTWSSSDESIVSVSQTGSVRAVSEGKATITATNGVISADIVFESINYTERIQFDRELDRIEEYEEELQMPLGEIGKGFNRVACECWTDNGTYFRGSVWLTLSDSSLPHFLYDDSPVNLRLTTHTFPNSILKVKVFNNSRYYKSSVRVDLKVYPLHFRENQQNSILRSPANLPQNEILEEKFAIP